MNCTCRCVVEPALGPRGVVAPLPLVVMPRWAVESSLSLLLLGVGVGGVPRGSGTRKRPRCWNAAACAAPRLPSLVSSRRRPPVQGGVWVLALMRMIVPDVLATLLMVLMPLLRRARSSSRGSRATGRGCAELIGQEVPKTYACRMNFKGALACRRDMVIGHRLMRICRGRLPWERTSAFLVTLLDALNLAAPPSTRPCAARRRVAPPPPATSSARGVLGCQLLNSEVPWAAPCTRLCMTARRVSRAGGRRSRRGDRCAGGGGRR